MTDLERVIAKVICAWLDTHEYKDACKEALSQKLAQRVATRLERKGVKYGKHN